MNQVLNNLDVEPILEGQFGEMPNASFGSLNAAGLVLDSAYQNISKKEWQDLIELAKNTNIADRIDDMFSEKSLIGVSSVLCCTPLYVIVQKIPFL